MKGAMFIGPLGLAVTSIAMRLGAWFVVIGSVSVVVIWTLMRWDLRRWSPTAIALWAVADDDADSRFASRLAVLSFGDRQALSAAEDRVHSANNRGGAERLAAARHLLDQLELPHGRRLRPRTVAMWCVAAVVGLASAAATGSVVWLAVAIVASTGATVAWSWWRVVERSRPEQLAELALQRVDPTTAPLPVFEASELLANATLRPAVMLRRSDEVIQRADLPLDVRCRAARVFERLPAREAPPTLRAFGTRVAITFFGVVTPWAVG